jgi:predicted 2-oxoglutarate/Fe(II)-dependent dioxygenase YbiX
LFIANDAYLTKLQYIEAINFSKYEIGGHYKWHLDSQKDIYTEHKGNGRDISASFFLDNPETYKGGELEFFDRGIENPPQPQGCLCLFPSLLTHRVKKVTSGKRSTLVIWGHIFNPDE